jgi:hypothetical protein
MNQPEKYTIEALTIPQREIRDISFSDTLILKCLKFHEYATNSAITGHPKANFLKQRKRSLRERFHQ